MAAQKCSITSQIKTLTTVWDAQFLLRYHTVANQSERQTVGAHSYAVSVLIDQLWPDSTKQLIMAALYHDVPEIILGDIPATAKWAYPEIQQAFEKAEKKVFDDLGLIFVLTPEEKSRLKMADMLELVLYTHRHSQGSDQMKMIMHSGINYLYEKFSSQKDFQPIKKVLAHYNLGGVP
jgi:5'-deoxynucleotidase YfbR-like HD superfamily hydrolase